MNTKNYQDEEVFKKIATIKKATQLQKSDHVQIIHMELEPGDYIEIHKTPMEVSFFLSHGSLDMQIGDDIQKINAGTLIESPKMISHGFSNNYKEIVNILVIKHLLTQ